MQSVMQHAFSQVPRAEIPRSSFDRSHGHKTTFNAGLLVPIFIDEALPGDTFNLNMTAFGRLATPIFPVMDNMFLDTFFFAVPIRLIWDNWEKFNGAQDNPDDSTDFLIPVVEMVAGGYSPMQIFDYMGLPCEGDIPGTNTIEHSALPLRAYNLIWNEWFRDQNLQDSVAVNKDDGPDFYNDYALLRRGKRHDYFTSALPWPQKGESVPLPLGSIAPIISAEGFGSNSGVPSFDAQDDSWINRGLITTTESPNVVGWSGAAVPTGDIGKWNYPNLFADLTDATAATINELRQAFQVQKLLERDARGGTRYTEIVRSHFGVVSPDARLQRPEYLGGGSSPINISPVAQTSETATTPQGNLSAFGTVHVRGHAWTKSFTEHCVIIGLACVRADLTYQQGLNRMWSRQTRYDFYWPALAHIGEQAILNKEIYVKGDANDDLVFGYQERFAEYRYKPSMVTGLFRSTNPTTLDAWHLSQEFTELPLLDSAFIVEDPPIDRVIAVDTEPHILFDSYFQLRCARPMPMFGVPGLIDHF